MGYFSKKDPLAYESYLLLHLSLTSLMCEVLSNWAIQTTFVEIVVGHNT